MSGGVNQEVKDQLAHINNQLALILQHIDALKEQNDSLSSKFEEQDLKLTRVEKELEELKTQTPILHADGRSGQHSDKSAEKTIKLYISRAYSTAKNIDLSNSIDEELINKMYNSLRGCINFELYNLADYLQEHRLVFCEKNPYLTFYKIKPWLDQTPNLKTTLINAVASAFPKDFFDLHLSSHKTTIISLFSKEIVAQRALQENRTYNGLVLFIRSIFSSGSYQPKGHPHPPHVAYLTNGLYSYDFRRYPTGNLQNNWPYKNKGYLIGNGYIYGALDIYTNSNKTQTAVESDIRNIGFYATEEIDDNAMIPSASTSCVDPADNMDALFDSTIDSIVNGLSASHPVSTPTESSVSNEEDYSAKDILLSEVFRGQKGVDMFYKLAAAICIDSSIVDSYLFNTNLNRMITGCSEPMTLSDLQDHIPIFPFQVSKDYPRLHGTFNDQDVVEQMCIVVKTIILDFTLPSNSMIVETEDQPLTSSSPMPDSSLPKKRKNRRQQQQQQQQQLVLIQEKDNG